MVKELITKNEGALLLAALSLEEECLQNGRECFDMGTLERQNLENKINVVQGLMKRFESVAFG